MSTIAIMSAGATTGASFLSLLAVDWVSWRRTRPVRVGIATAQYREPPGLRTSRTTHLAWISGVAIVAIGAVVVPRMPTAGVLVVLGGATVAVPGWAARVTRVEASTGGLTISYARRRPFCMRWKDCQCLRPPRWPAGGWQILAPGGSRTLMPSDLLGHERLLVLLVRRAGLAFQAGAWNSSEAQAGGRGVPEVRARS